MTTCSILDIPIWQFTLAYSLWAMGQDITALAIEAITKMRRSEELRAASFAELIVPLMITLVLLAAQLITGHTILIRDI